MVNIRIEIGDGNVYLVANAALAPGFDDIMKAHEYQIAAEFNNEREDFGSWTSQSILFGKSMRDGRFYVRYYVEKMGESFYIAFKDIPFNTYRTTTWVEEGKEKFTEWRYRVPIKTVTNREFLDALGLHMEKTDRLGDEWEYCRELADNYPGLLEYVEC